MKESIKGVNELAIKKGIKTHRDIALVEAERLKDDEFKAEETYIIVFNDMIKAKNRYKYLAKVVPAKERELSEIRRKRYEAVCKVLGKKPIELEKDTEE